MKRLVVIGGFIVVLCAMGLGAGAWWFVHRKPPKGHKPHAPVGEIFKIANNLYMVPAGGGNTAVFVTTNGVVLVDTKYPERYPALLEQVRKVTDKPITHVINTHVHADHRGGNRFLAESVEIIVQENTAKNMEKMRLSATPPDPPRPLRTYKDKLTLFNGEDAIDLYYFGPAHTDGDSFVVFRAAGVMHAGDVFPDKIAPVININWGGDGKTFGETIGKAAAEIKNVKQVITGHGPVFSWTDFVDYGEFNTALLKQARSAIASGKNQRQALDELRLPSKFQSYSLKRVASTLGEIYDSLGQ